MTPPSIRFILGHRHAAADGVADYCEHVIEQLRGLRRTVDLAVLPWEEAGWLRALAGLERGTVRGSWHVLHFNNFSWARKGVPFMLPVLVRRLHSLGARVAVRFHDPHGHPGSTPLLVARRAMQEHLMNRIARAADLSLHNVPVESATWLTTSDRAHYIPVGSNVPGGPNTAKFPNAHEPLRIAVFCITGGTYSEPETTKLAAALKRASILLDRPIQLVAVGSGTAEAAGALERALTSSRVSSTCHGMIPPEEVGVHLRTCHALLFVRGPICTQRTTVVAALANGLPVVGFRGPATAGPILDAGIAHTASDDPSELAESLVSLVADEKRWLDARAKTATAFERHFSWAKIAEQYSHLLQ